MHAGASDCDICRTIDTDCIDTDYALWECAAAPLPVKMTRMLSSHATACFRPSFWRRVCFQVCGLIEEQKTDAHPKSTGTRHGFKLCSEYPECANFRWPHRDSSANGTLDYSFSKVEYPEFANLGVHYLVGLHCTTRGYVCMASVLSVPDGHTRCISSAETSVGNYSRSEK